MLVAEAAARWNIDPTACEARDGRVIHAGQSLAFEALAEAAASRTPPSPPPLRRGEHPLAGKPLPRLDAPAKSSGAFRFAGDVRLDGMLYASARIAPPGGRLRRHNGASDVVVGDGWIAAVAESSWAAEQRLKRADAQFAGPRSPLSIDAILDDALAAGESETLVERGDYAAAVGGSRALTALYRAAPALHLGLEPLSATARVTGGDVELWAASQAPELGRELASRSAGGNVAFYPMPTGDGGGRAMEPDAAPIAIELARRLRRPVQLTLSGAASQNHDRASPPALARLYALPGAGGLAAAWKMRLVTANGLGSALGRLAGEEGQPTATARAPSFPYNVPNVRIDGVTPALPFAAGYMRGSPERELTFFTESFVDELARAAGLDPLTYRVGLLGPNPRLANCLQRATRIAGWDGGGPGSTMGLAAASVFGSHIALVAEATFGTDQSIEVHKLTASVDCGRIVNPGIVEQQVASGMIWALGQCQVAAPEWTGGIPLSRALGTLPLPRLARTPDIRVDLVPNGADPGGASGLGIAVLAPAVANALHAATGKRLRTLPFEVQAA
jgi:isoquinoline 1-oxidoreductase beta subunit